LKTRTADAVDFQENEEYIIDGSERPVQRDTYDQKEFYSGKKGTHTVKNALIVSTFGIILWLGTTYPGRHHDKTLVNHLSFSKSITLLADLGFLAWEPNGANVLLPHKNRTADAATKYKNRKTRPHPGAKRC
jgi:hypothetical protein